MYVQSTYKRPKENYLNVKHKIDNGQLVILGDLGSPIIPHHNDSPVNGWNSWYSKKCGM